jgi:hypothetical protein
MTAPTRTFLLCVAFGALSTAALAQEDVRSCDELLPEAQAALEAANDAFNRLGTEGSESHATRLEAESNCEKAMGNCDIALEYFEDECGREAEDIMTKATSLYFWIHRTAPMSFFDWKNKEQGLDEGDLFTSEDYEEITRKSREERAQAEARAEERGTEEEATAEAPAEPTPADLACKMFEEAQAVEKKDPFDAVLAYSAVASEYPDQECGKRAMARVAEIMNPTSDEEKPSLSKIVSSLKQGLNSSDPGDQIRAARDARNMKAKAVVLPIVDVLRKEKPDSKVVPYLLATLRTTHRRETCFQLGDARKGGLRRFPDKDSPRQIAVIDCLADIGGPLGAQAIGSFLASRNQKVIDHCFAKLEGIGIDGGIGLAVGFQALLKNRNQANVNRCLDLMGKLKHPSCVSAILYGGKGLISTRQKKNPYFDKVVGRDINQPPELWTGGILAQIGWNGIWVLIDEGMGSGDQRTRTYSQFAAKKITGWQLGMSDTEWRAKFREEVSSGARPLPYGMKSIP